MWVLRDIRHHHLTLTLYLSPCSKQEVKVLTDSNKFPIPLAYKFGVSSSLDPSLILSPILLPLCMLHCVCTQTKGGEHLLSKRIFYSQLRMYVRCFGVTSFYAHRQDIILCTYVHIMLSEGKHRDFLSLQERLASASSDGENTKKHTRLLLHR